MFLCSVGGQCDTRNQKLDEFRGWNSNNLFVMCHKGKMSTLASEKIELYMCSNIKHPDMHV